MTLPDNSFPKSGFPPASGSGVSDLSASQKQRIGKRNCRSLLSSGQDLAKAADTKGTLEEVAQRTVRTAQRTIRDAWRAFSEQKSLRDRGLGHITENREPLYFAIKKLKEASFEDLYTGVHDDLVESCILRAEKTRNRPALKWLCYVLFSRQASRCDDLSELLKFLRNHIDNEEISIKELAFVVRAAFKEWKMDPRSLELEADLKKAENVLPQPDDPFRTVEDPLIDVTHGGGLWFIKDFLAGRNRGYIGSEYEGTAFFVSPRDRARNTDSNDAFYANRASNSSFDMPVRMRASIDPHKLFGVPNAYEAALRHPNSGAFRDRHLESIPKEESIGRIEWCTSREGMKAALIQAMGENTIPPSLLNKINRGV